MHPEQEDQDHTKRLEETAHVWCMVSCEDHVDPAPSKGTMGETRWTTLGAKNHHESSDPHPT